MTFSEGFRKSADRASTGGGVGRGGIAVGGGLGGILLVGLYLLLGGDPAALTQDDGTGAQGGGQAQHQGLEHCRTGADANEHVDCRIEFTGISLDRVWGEQLPKQAGIEYTAPSIVIFDGSTRSACGTASAGTGPFYCPADETSYYDVSFFNQLQRLGGGSGPLSQEYVVAHEFGWAHHADDGPDAILEPLTDEQVRDAMATARAIGDDAIQSHSGGGVNPDLWTHASSEQREKAFLTGYRTGDMRACDTLGREGAYR